MSAPLKQSDNPFLEVSQSLEDNGNYVGKDPRTIEVTELRKLRVREHMNPNSNFQPVIESPIKAIRAKCIDCSGGTWSEVRKCVATACPLWPFRMGVNVFHSRRGTSDAGEGQEGENTGL
jgi:hypothetical protein